MLPFALDATVKVLDSLDDSGIGTSFDFLDFLTGHCLVSLPEGSSSNWCAMSDLAKGPVQSIKKDVLLDLVKIKSDKTTSESYETTALSYETLCGQQHDIIF